MAYQYQHIACGGTFDLLHKGHQTVLLAAFKKAKFVSIGITTDFMNKKLNKPTFQIQNLRRRELEDFLKSKKLNRRSKIILLDDIYGSTLSDKTIEALVVSEETLGGAERINEARIKRGLKRLPIIICPKVLAQDKKMLSSSRIREGIIARSGQSYLSSLHKIANKPITKEVRRKLKKPLGPLVKVTRSLTLKNAPFMAVGDMTVSTFLKFDVCPNISVVDLFIGRQRKFSNLAQLGFANNKADFVIKNPRGIISKQLIQILKRAINHNKQKMIIQVLGEEDLATIPAILLSPLGFSIYYGQPARGTVMVKVTEKIKQDICSVFKLK